MKKLSRSSASIARRDVIRVIFFFQAEDGIRDYKVTGVQTCALPILAMLSVFGKEVFRAGAFGIGLLFAARGLGALFGPFLVRAVSARDELQYRLIKIGRASCRERV